MNTLKIRTDLITKRFEISEEYLLESKPKNTLEKVKLFIRKILTKKNERYTELELEQEFPIV